jgi:hypothetical protein
MRDLIDLIESKTKCQTPGANYKFEIHGKKVISTVTLPFSLDLSEDEFKKLDDELHDALEGVFKQFFKNS